MRTMRVFQFSTVLVLTAGSVAATGTVAGANGCEGDPATCVAVKPTTTTTTTPVPTTTTTAAPVTPALGPSTVRTQVRVVPAPVPTTTTVVPVADVAVLGARVECKDGSVAVPVRNTGTGTGTVTARMAGETAATAVTPGTTQVVHLDLGPQDAGRTLTVRVSGDVTARQRVAVPCGTDATSNAGPERCPWQWQAFLLGILAGLLLAGAIAMIVLAAKRRDTEPGVTPELDPVLPVEA